MADQQSTSGAVIDRSGHPLAITPLYTTAEPNAPVLLYQGPLELAQESKRIRGRGTVHYEWSPTPRPRFCLKAESPLPLAHAGTGARLAVSERAAEMGCSVTSVNMRSDEGNSTLSVAGRINHGSVGSAGARLKCLIFHLANFRDLLGRSESVIRYESGQLRAGRLVLKGGGWTVTVDAVEDDKRLRDALRDRSGHAITHTAKLERSDGKEFDVRSGIELLDALWWFFSFAEGRWTGPLLPVGFDAEGHRAWEEWRGLKVAPWKFVLSWLDDFYPSSLAQLFPNFLSLWQDPDWHETLRLAVHWYVEANNQAGAIEGGIVLTQTAFELLAWSIIVDKEGRISASSFDRLPAADKTRLLISWANLPLAIPGPLTELATLAARKQWSDAAQAFTAIRNAITHPSPKNRERFSDYPSSAKTEVWNLGLWFLELFILRLLDYRGPVGNRLKLRFSGEVEPVPWDVPPPTEIPVFPDSEDDPETDAEVLRQFRAMG